MKKITRFSIASVLVLSVILMSVSTVFASSTTTATEWADPTATANGKDVTFTGTVYSPFYLPGTINDGATMILPTGFDGFAQFGGNGIEISGLSAAQTVNLSFAFPTYQYGWSGSIYQWDGSKWVALTTTVVAPTGENSLYYVTTNKVHNGTYALLIHYTQPTE